MIWLLLAALSMCRPPGSSFPKQRRHETAAVLGTLQRPARSRPGERMRALDRQAQQGWLRSEEHTSELQSPDHLVCRLLLEKKKIYVLIVYHAGRNNISELFKLRLTSPITIWELSTELHTQLEFSSELPVTMAALQRLVDL